MKRRSSILLCATAVLFFGQCSPARPPSIEDLSTGTLTEIRRIEMIGRRDGDRMPVEVRLETPDSRLLLRLDVRIGVPTTLNGGTFEWEGSGPKLEGLVRARSLTFLGGQSDNPNLGGVFELLGRTGAGTFRVNLPTSEVRPR